MRRIRFPRTNAYLVDSGIAGLTRPIEDAVGDAGNQPDLLLLTHTHYDLHEHGFPGVAVHVPSHSRDSLAFVADDGSCFCGDVLFNLVPWSLMPPFADSPRRLHAH